jgi:hypothetical protein
VNEPGIILACFGGVYAIVGHWAVGFVVNSRGGLRVSNDIIKTYEDPGYS